MNKKDRINLAIDLLSTNLLELSLVSIKQKTFSYERLGRHSILKILNIQLASSYYDTILKISTDTLNLRFRRIKRKHKNFASLIRFRKYCN